MNSRLFVFYCSALENHECWNALNLVTSGNLRILIHIYFDDPDAVAKFARYFFQNGRLSLAWPAPHRMKINNDRFLIANYGVEIRFHFCTL